MQIGNLRLHCYNTTTKFKKFISFIKLGITSQLEMISSKVKNNNNKKKQRFWSTGKKVTQWITASFYLFIYLFIYIHLPHKINITERK